MPDLLQFRPAVRKAAPLLISIASVSGGGKTYTSLLLAAGLAGPGGKVGMLDTENGRGEMYADSPGIMKALPHGFAYIGMDPPFSPERYIQYIKAAEKNGIDVLVIDSGSHEWEGTGGCCEIAESAKGMPNWSSAKREHKKFVNTLLSTNMHIIVCLRARDKIKIFNKGDEIVLGPTAPGLPGEPGPPVAEKTTIMPLGLQPIAEKSFVYEMLLSIMLDEMTHHGRAIKVPEGLRAIFDRPRLLTMQDGEQIRKWNSGGKHMEGEALRRLQMRAQEAFEGGLKAYGEFWNKELTKEDRQALASVHEANKAAAEAVDKGKVVTDDTRTSAG